MHVFTGRVHSVLLNPDWILRLCMRAQCICKLRTTLHVSLASSTMIRVEDQTYKAIHTYTLTWQKGNFFFEDRKHLHCSHLLISPETWVEKKRRTEQLETAILFGKELVLWRITAFKHWGLSPLSDCLHQEKKVSNIHSLTLTHTPRRSREAVVGAKVVVRLSEAKLRGG